MSRNDHNSKSKIHHIDSTDERLTSRGGLVFFVKYLSNIGLYPLLNRLFGTMRKNKKGQRVWDIFKQIFCFLLDGTSYHITRFDELKKDEAYAGIVEESTDDLASSHAVKRFFRGFSYVRVWLFRRVLQTLFIWRLKIQKPPIIVLGIDVMPMDNNDAVKREGVEPTYKSRTSGGKVKGFAPLQVNWGPYIIDAVFRGGSKHSNHGNTVETTVKHIVGLIRQKYDKDAVILLRCDAGFFDQKLMQQWEGLGIAYVMGGKIYDDIRHYLSAVPTDCWQEYENKEQIWDYLEMGDCRGSWKQFRRMFYCQARFDENDQMVLDFARPDTVIYTNLGVDEKITEQFHKARLDRYLTAAGIIETYHQQGSDELVHRALKEFGSERLPFKRFTQNAAFYYCMLVAFFLYEAFKEDVASEVVPVACYANTLRRVIIDTAAKIIKSGGQIIVKFYAAAYNQIKARTLWERALNPPPLLAG